MAKSKRFGSSVSSRGWNKKNLKARRKEFHVIPVLKVKITTRTGRHSNIRYVTVHKLPTGRKMLYDVSVFFEKMPMGYNSRYSSRKSVRNLTDAEAEVNKHIEYYCGRTVAWEFRVQVLRKR